MSIRQASCVAVAGRAVLIEGRPGCGKSSLALALIDRGATFVADDGVSITVRKARLHASPVDRTRNLMEVRNLGLIEMQAAGDFPICLAITLTSDAPRFIEAPRTLVIEGCSLPHVLLTPHDPVLAIKTELALDRFGLPLS